MRPLLITDLIAAARVLAAVRDEDRGAWARRLVFEARLADCHRLSTARSHPRFGNGSLMAAAARHPKRDDCGVMDGDILRALRSLIGVVLDEGPDGDAQVPFVSCRRRLYCGCGYIRGARHHGGNQGQSIVDRSGLAADL